MEIPKTAIALDAMGCDLGVKTAVDGALAALEDKHLGKIILVGREGEILPVLRASNYDKNRVEVLHTEEVITPSDPPTTAIKSKKDSSIVVGLNLVKDGRAAAFVSAGSTGALLTGGTLIVGRIKGVLRPALGAILPSKSGHVLLMDVGASPDAKPEYLAQYAHMGSIYMESLLDIKNPKVGLINNGAEKEKGNALTKAAYNLLENAGLNFVGNVEGREIPLGAVDVAVCDAFVGNILLKYTEGFAKGMMSMIKEELMASVISKFGALLAKGAFGRLRKRFDYTEVGGAPFLGLKGLVVKAHGSSDAKAICNAIKQCSKFVNADVASKIAQRLGGMVDGV